MPALLVQPMTGSGKRRGGDRPHASELRWADKTPKDLRAAADDLRVAAAELEAMADAMAEAGAKHVRVDGAMKLPKGLELVQTFAVNVQKALLDWGNRNR